MPQIHLRAEPGDYAPVVLLPGDPNRATRIASRFDGGLEAARRVNDHRLLYGYTGTWQGRPVSVQTTGMGTPSLSIVVEELLRLGATRLIRVGTCGGMGAGVRTGDLVIANGAEPLDGATLAYLRGDRFAPVPDFELTRALVDAAKASGARYHVGPVATVDVFYNTDPDYARRWKARGVVAVEMEAAALFYLAARAWSAGADVRAACALTVSDVIEPDLAVGDTYMSLDDLEAATDRTIDVALAAAATL